MACPGRLRAPRMQLIADRSRENTRRQRSHDMVSLYGLSHCMGCPTFGQGTQLDVCKKQSHHKPYHQWQKKSEA